MVSHANDGVSHFSAPSPAGLGLVLSPPHTLTGLSWRLCCCATCPWYPKSEMSGVLTVEDLKTGGYLKCQTSQTGGIAMGVWALPPTRIILASMFQFNAPRTGVLPETVV